MKTDLVPERHCEALRLGRVLAQRHVQRTALLHGLAAASGALREARRDERRRVALPVCDALLVVVCHGLLGGARHSIVVRRHSNGRLQHVGLHRDIVERLELARGVHVARSDALPELKRGARREVPAPVVVRPVRERENVVLPDLPLDARRALRFDVDRRRRVERVDAGVHVDVVNQAVEVVVPRLCVLVVEVRPHCPHDVVRLRVRRLILGVSHDLVHPAVDVVVVLARIILNLVVATVERADRRTVTAAAAAVELSGKALRGGAQRFAALPDPLGARLILPHIEVLVVHPAKEEGVHTRLRAEKPCLRVRVSERVDLPRHARANPEVPHQELVPTRCLIDHLDVVRRRLVVHAPATVDELELAGCDELFHHLLPLRSLLVPPASEERDLDVDELAVRVHLEARDDSLDNVLHFAVVVLVHRDEPSCARGGYIGKER